MVEQNLKPNEAVQFIKEYFDSNIQTFKLLDEGCSGPFWSIEFAKSKVSVKLSGDASIEVEIKDNGEIFKLWTVDKSLLNHLNTSKTNLLIHLNLIRKLVSN